MLLLLYVPAPNTKKCGYQEKERERRGYKETPRCVVLNRETDEAKLKKKVSQTKRM